MEIVEATAVDNSFDDDKTYKISLDMVQVDRIFINIFNTRSGFSFKTFIDKDSEWYKSNIYIYRDDFSQLYNILDKSLVQNDESLKYVLNEEKEKICLKISYNNDMFPFEIVIDIPRYISEKGELEDRINSLEYQVERLRSKIKSKSLKVNDKMVDDIGEIYNIYGHLVYKGQMKEGKPHGKGIKYFEDSEIIQYEGEFKNGLYDGYGVLANHGYGDTTNGNKPVCAHHKGYFIKGLKHGEIVNDDSLNGKEYNNYKMGLRDGLQKSVNNNGSINTHYYKDGVREGEFKTVDKDGNVIALTNFVNGKVV